ncbi:hypothetical protein [Romboutsia sp.]|uniref:hypothetical protein n=1 Tax=Romboutsia sp. TaxID=1965302 RepID=UPI003F3000A9
MKLIRTKPEEFKIEKFIEYISDNLEELLLEYPKEISRVCLIDKDYLDVILFEEEYEEINNSKDYADILLSEEYGLLLTIAKTNENLDKLEFIDGKKYSLSHYIDDIYQDNAIKDIGDLSLDMSHLVSILVDLDDGEIVLSLVNFEHGGQISQPKIMEAEDSGDFEEVVKVLVEKFM